jgi:hypothetical protein
MKLEKIIPGTAKKWTAIFNNDGKIKRTHFGAKGYTDYTLSHDKEQRDRYRKRHAKDLATNDPTAPGFLSYYILWGESTSIQANIASYKRKFNL